MVRPIPSLPHPVPLLVPVPVPSRHSSARIHDVNKTQHNTWPSRPGPCQFPTLGFVVARYNQVKAFTPEDFWYILLSLNRAAPDGEELQVDFGWRRGHLFDEEVVQEIYGGVIEAERARVVKVTEKNVKKW